MGEDKIAEKMSESSDQKVPEKSPGKPALGKNIKDLSEQEVKRKTAEEMSRKRGLRTGHR